MLEIAVLIALGVLVGGVLVSAARFLREHFYGILTGIGALLLAAPGMLGYFDPSHLERFQLLVVAVGASGALFTLVGIVGSEVAEASRRDLLQQNQTLSEQLRESQQNVFETFHEYLAYLADEVLEFGVQDRVAIYIHQSRGYVRLDRYSRSYELGEAGRTLYPAKQAGAIARAWNQERFVCQHLPDWRTDLEAYLRRLQEDQGIPVSISRRFVMKSRSVAAYRIPRPGPGQALGVVVFESLQPSRYADVLVNHVFPIHAKILGYLMCTMSLPLPDPAFAESRGL